MKMLTHESAVLDVSSLAGLMVGMLLLLPAVFVPELRYLAVPAGVVLIPSLLYCLR